MSDELPPVTTKLLAVLRGADLAFDTLQHEPVFTSQEAANVRGSDLHSGAKALVVKGDDTFMMAVIPADLELDSVALRKRLGSKKLRFANKYELKELTGLEPGAVPPFGSLFELPTICDPTLGENESINFNAGSNSFSITMAYEDYIHVERPAMAPITKAGGA